MCFFLPLFLLPTTLFSLETIYLKTNAPTLSDSTHSQVVIRAAGAGLQVEVWEGELQLAALAGPDAPVALSVRVVGQREVRGGESSRGRRQRPSTALEIGIKSIKL